MTFGDLYGIQNAIADLKVSIIEPFHNPGKYIDLGISPPRGVIVHGPPGVGKTMLCCALAEELGINFMLVEVRVHNENATVNVMCLKHATYKILYCDI